MYWIKKTMDYNWYVQIMEDIMLPNDRKEMLPSNTVMTQCMQGKWSSSGQKEVGIPEAGAPSIKVLSLPL